MTVAGRKDYIKQILIPGILIFIIIGVCICIINHHTKVKLMEAQRSADYEMAGLLHEKYPELSAYEIARVIKNRDFGETTGSDYYEEGQRIFSEYGYDDSYTSPFVKNVIRNGVIECIAVVAVGLAVYAFIIFMVQRRKAKEIAEVTGYIHNLNDKQYDLMMSDNTEDELSLLRNEVYKTTVMLREIAENKTLETKRLSESLQDISHQLRTPLASMSLMIDNICEDEDMPDELRREFLNDIQSEVTWMSSLVNSLLVLAKFDAGTIVMNEEEIDARELLDEAVKRLGVLLDLHDVKAVWDDKGSSVDEEQPKITFTGDKKWQLEAVSNIIKNCAEHSNPGGNVYLSVEQNSIYTKLTIRDEGEGMTSEDMRHIFERFYKSKNAKPDSIGIGLSLAKTIVEAGKGYITVDSTVGEGTTFEIKYMR